MNQAVATPASNALHRIEEVAVELATLAGAEIVQTLGGIFSVRYKPDMGRQTINLQDPVSEVDGRIEQLIRSRLGVEFPDHDIIGEEMANRPARAQDFVWAVDPIDGTMNFVNGFPIFAASIGVLYRGRPVAGAVWSSISHALRPGVYHASANGPLRFEGENTTPTVNPAVRRKLAGLPHSGPEEEFWDFRKTGSAAVECALVAAGLLEVAHFAAPNIWDVAGGIVLVRAAGGAVQRFGGTGWVPMHSFEDDFAGDVDLRRWRNAVVIGRSAAVAKMCSLHPTR
jgi:myo-inositol-1(or 4)-monophosphatase